MKCSGSIFTVTFRAPAGPAGIHALRALLKAARRRFGLIAIDASEKEDAPTNIAGAFEQLRRDVHDRLRERSS